MSAHTPGPWRAMYYGVVADHPVPGINGSDDVAHYGGHLIAESVAPQNTALIAAAPDLLAALVMVRDADNDCALDGFPTIPASARARIDAAIAKAEGTP